MIVSPTNEPVTDAIEAQPISGSHLFVIKKATVKPIITEIVVIKNDAIILGPSLMMSLTSQVSMNIISIIGRNVEYIMFCAAQTPSALGSHKWIVAPTATRIISQSIDGITLKIFEFGFFFSYPNIRAIKSNIKPKKPSAVVIKFI